MIGMSNRKGAVFFMRKIGKKILLVLLVILFAVGNWYFYL